MFEFEISLVSSKILSQKVLASLVFKSSRGLLGLSYYHKNKGSLYFI